MNFVGQFNQMQKKSPWKPLRKQALQTPLLLEKLPGLLELKFLKTVLNGKEMSEAGIILKRNTVDRRIIDTVSLFIILVKTQRSG